jgi:transcriptional regulator with XRE-family HTH domain
MQSYMTMKKDARPRKHVLPGTIVVDPSVAFQRNLGAYNNTIVHECVHWALHKKAFALEQLFNAEASQIKCKVVGGIEGQEKDDTKWMEWQANALAPRIQMPLEMFKRQASATIRKYRDQLGVFELCELMPFVIEDLATFFMVSRTAAKLRMIDAGYEEAMGSFIYIDGRYVKPHAFKKGSIKSNQTYSLPARDAAIQSIVNPKLKDTDKYVYVDSHFVLNHPRYVYQNDEGETLMTDYARYHVDECCLAFDLSICGKMEERYHRECFLNRDQGSPIDFDIVYTGDNGELDDERRKKLLHDTVMEEAKVLDGLSNNYTKAWKELLKWRGISQAELSRRTTITEKTIGNIINGETVGTINNVVLMCLAANLPWDMSDYLIQRSGHQLLYNNDDHNWYRFVLKHMYPKSIPEIQAFLQEQGASPL